MATATEHLQRAQDLLQVADEQRGAGYSAPSVAAAAHAQAHATAALAAAVIELATRPTHIDLAAPYGEPTS